MALGKCKECGKEVSNTAKVCPNCGVKNPTLTFSQSFLQSLLGAVALGVIILVLYASCSESDGEKQDPVDTTCSDDGEWGRITAHIYAQYAVKESLKSPSTADFPSLPSSWRMYDKTADDSCSFEIKSYVDAQNSFGAVVRTNYEAHLKYHKEKWSLKTLGWR